MSDNIAKLLLREVFVPLLFALCHLRLYLRSKYLLKQ